MTFSTALPNKAQNQGGNGVVLRRELSKHFRPYFLGVSKVQVV